MRARAVSLALVAALSLRCSPRAGTGGDACAPGDTDGVQGGPVTFVVTVDDQGFTPSILKAQNLAPVTLTLKNAGTRAHDFAVDCLATPNDRGCPATSCFSADAAIAPLAAGATQTITFVTPNPEGIYVFRSNLPGDAQTGQLVVQ